MMAQVLKVIRDTYLKIRPVSTMELSEQEKWFVQDQNVLEILSYFEEGDYYKITLEFPISGLDTWFILQDHVEIIQIDLDALDALREVEFSAERLTSSPPSLQTSNTIDAELKKLTSGKVLFDTPHQMKVGVSERVSVRIAKTITQDFSKGLAHSQEAEIENIRISRFMSVSLSGDDFKVEALGNEEQIIEDNDFTQWDWKVVPLKGGNRKLWVSITIQVEAENEQARKSLPVLEKEILVKINPIYSTSTFVSQHWQWLIASATIPIVGLLLNKK